MICENCGVNTPVHKTTRPGVDTKREYRCECGHHYFTFELTTSQIKEYKNTIDKLKRDVADQEQDKQDKQDKINAFLAAFSALSN